ncbi:MAG: 5'/3'-nucleotidase SurE [Deltaproteobacteria bacterium]|nr:5'/3'-nucleotidase SurE [Deltaproteobacteria bacterium]MBW2601277.1 5'/3'-nucleotidase SurE [Deltaproteobacteria bacterium]
MDILLTNDDGIHAEGLWAMERVLSGRHNVYVVAPDKERSAIGHSITLAHPLRVNRIKTNGGWGYAVTGTPADCVKLAIREILERIPDMVVSGINPGANVGINLNYSGTVSAAKEAALMGVPAIAVSKDLSLNDNYSLVTAFVSDLIAKVVKNGLPRATFLNVNIPDCSPEHIQGVRITRQGTAPLISIKSGFHRRVDPRNEVYYWQGVERQAFEEEVESDGAALCANCISVTPVQCDMTDYESIETLKTWDFGLA